MNPQDPRIPAARTRGELREEVVLRIESNGYPGLGGRLPHTVGAMAAHTSFDPDEWASEWMAAGDHTVGAAEQSAGPTLPRALFQSAFAAYTTGRFSTPVTPAKRASPANALGADMRYAESLPPKLEVVRIAFDGEEIIGNFSKPEGAGPFLPMLRGGGLDFRKEQVADEALSCLPHGLCVYGIDMPGTGQSPIRADVGSERIFSRVFDGAETRPDGDSTRVFMRGAGGSGQWANRVAIAEEDRSLGAIDHGGAVRHSFQPQWQWEALGIPEYLLDLFGARATVFGVETLDEFLDDGPHRALPHDDMIDSPCAPMLAMNVAKDSRLPVADRLPLLQRGDAEEGWINPRGGHMGFGVGDGPRRTIGEIVAPWLLECHAPHDAREAAQ